MITEKSVSAYKTISEVSKKINVPSHVLRFWETKFSQVKPIKRSGGRRYYRSEDINVLNQIRTLLYQEGYTIKGAQKVLKSYLKSNTHNLNIISEKNPTENYNTSNSSNQIDTAKKSDSREKVLQMLKESELRIDVLISRLSR